MTERTEETDLDPFADEDEEDMSLAARTARLDRSIDALAGDDESGEESEDEEAEEVPESDAGVDIVLNAIQTQEAMKAESDARFAEQWAEAETLLPGYIPPPAELSREELAAVEIAKLDPSSAAFQDMFNLLKNATEESDRKQRAGTDGYDSEGTLVEPPFSPASLSSEDFANFMDAVATGGARPGRIPAGETYETWNAKVQSALGRQ